MQNLYERRKKIKWNSQGNQEIDRERDRHTAQRLIFDKNENYSNP